MSHTKYTMQKYNFSTYSIYLSHIQWKQTWAWARKVNQYLLYLS